MSYIHDTDGSHARLAAAYPQFADSSRYRINGITDYIFIGCGDTINAPTGYDFFAVMDIFPAKQYVATVPKVPT